jgi:hypothetical protein
MAYATETSLRLACVQLAKNNILERVVAPCFRNGSVDLTMLRKELRDFKPAISISKDVTERCFATMMRQVEHHVITHLSASLAEEDSDLDTLGTKLDGLSVGEPLQGAAPHVQVDVVPRPPTARDGKQVLTSFDQLREVTQPKLVIRGEKDGRMVNPSTDTVWIKAGGHWVCIGHKRGPHTTLLTPEDVAFCESNHLAYDKSKVEKADEE